MDKETLKIKILEKMKQNGNMDKWHEAEIGSLVFILAKDYTDLNNLAHAPRIYNALCELEKEGKVVCTLRIQEASRWYLK